MKHCGKCKVYKEFVYFGLDNARKDKLQPTCKPCRSLYSRRYRVANPGRLAQIQKAADRRYKENHCNRRRAYERSENTKRYRSLYRKQNKGVVNEACMRHFAAKRSATPKWLTKAQILQMRALYHSANRISKCLGLPHEIDHIVPIQGKTVTGLHVPWNLQIIPASANRSKGNRF